MKIVLSKRAEKQLLRLSKIDQIATARKIREIKVKKNNLKTEKLKGYKDIFRVRLGDYRTVYRFSPTELYIVLIGHRKDIYRLLNQLFD